MRERAFSLLQFGIGSGIWLRDFSHPVLAASISPISFSAGKTKRNA